MLDSKIGYPLQFLRVHHGSGGVRGEIQHDYLGARGDAFFHFSGTQGKVVLCLGLHHHGHSVGHVDGRTVADVAGFVIDDFVPRIQQGAEGQVQGLRDAHSDDDFLGRIVGHMEFFRDVFGDAFPQFQQAEVAGVGGLAFFEGIDRCLPDVPGGREVRLADAKRDHIAGVEDQFEEFADPGAGNRLDAVRNFAFGAGGHWGRRITGWFHSS